MPQNWGNFLKKKLLVFGPGRQQFLATPLLVRRQKLRSRADEKTWGSIEDAAGLNETWQLLQANMATSVPKGAKAEQADGVGEQSSRRGCALERGCGVIQYLEAESCGSSRSSALVQTNGFRLQS
jgi:hypothetical protein